MSREIKHTSQFKKDVKLMLRQGRQLKPLLDVVEMLQNDIPLPPELKDHPLVGNWIGKRECHIEPDWLLIYEKTDSVLLLTLIRTGTHSGILGL